MDEERFGLAILWLGMLRSYNNKDHNFELNMLSLVILYISLLFCKCFPILKNVKRACPKNIIKGQK